MDPNQVPTPDQNSGQAVPQPQPVQQAPLPQSVAPPEQLPQLQPVQTESAPQAIQQPVQSMPINQQQVPVQQQTQQMPQQFPPQQPVYPQQNTSPAPGTPEAQASMRSKILKIIAGLTVFSLLGVGAIVLLSGSADATLSDRIEDGNTKATYQIPRSWASNTSIEGTDYFNGESKQGSSAVVSSITPQRLKFSGEPLTESEVAEVIREIGNLETRGLDGEIDLIQSGEIVETGGFQRVFEYFYEAVGSDGGTKVNGKLRLYFDEQAYMHGFEVAAVKSYWQTNQAELETILETYALSR